MGVAVSHETGAAHWASYLVNGDASGMEESDIELADKWAANLAPAYVVDVERDENGEACDPWFSWSFGLYTGAETPGGDCLSYTLHTPAGESVQ